VVPKLVTNIEKCLNHWVAGALLLEFWHAMRVICSTVLLSAPGLLHN